MQEAIPYKTWLPVTPQTSLNRSPPPINLNDADFSVHGEQECLKKTVSENALIVFGRRGCCMTHVVKRLLQGLGVNPAVYEVGEDEEAAVVKELESIGDGGDKDGQLQFPAVFIGGRLFGGLDRLMATHITGELTPILREARALWL